MSKQKRNKTRGKNFEVRDLGRLASFTLARLRIKELTRNGQMPGTTIVHVTLPPRYAHASIVHRWTDEWFLVLKGGGYGVVDQKRVRMKPGTIVYMAAGVPHQMGTNSRAMEVLAVFTPPLDPRRPDADIHPASCVDLHPR